MAHSPGYPTDNNRQPDREERSREKQRGLQRGSWDEEALRLGKRVCILNYRNTQYNNLFNIMSVAGLGEGKTMGLGIYTTTANAVELLRYAYFKTID